MIKVIKALIVVGATTVLIVLIYAVARLIGVV